MKGESDNPPDLRERSFLFALRVVKLCQSLETEPGISRVLSRQLLRAGTSIGANAEEARGSRSKADFTAKLYIAYKEARETHYWLRLLAASNLVPEKRLHDLTDEANQLVAILTTSVKKCRAPRINRFAFHLSLFTPHSSSARQRVVHRLQDLVGRVGLVQECGDAQRR